MAEAQIGKVTHFFDQIGVAVLELTKTLKVGDTVRFHGHTTDFTQEVASMQIEHKPVKQAKAGENAALKVDQPVHPNDAVFKVSAKKA
jgi:translation elongation factor EF-1alpha